MSPDLAQQLYPRGNGTTPPHEGEQKIELFRAERHHLAGLRDSPGRGIDLDIPESLDRLQRRVPTAIGHPRPPEQRADARQQLEHTAWLGDVVVGAQSEAEHLVRLLTARGQDQHGHLEPVIAKALQNAVTVHPGEHQIEDDEIGEPLAGTREAGLAIFGDGDLVSLDLEAGSQAVREIRIVLDDENVPSLSGHQCSLVTGARSVARTGSGAGDSTTTMRTGSSMTTRAPPRVPADSIHAVPPWSITNSRTTDRPIPLPPDAASTFRLRRTYGSQTRSRSAIGIPGP